eukprot:12410300-Alexandrium_andersonii.AAC.1
MVDCGLRRIAALTGLRRIAYCTLSTPQCEGTSNWVPEGAITLLAALCALCGCVLKCASGA